jgi:hypothetical protein
MGLFQLNQNSIQIITDSQEEAILWAEIDRLCDIKTIKPFAYSGTVAASPFTVFDANISYLAKKFTVSYYSLVTVSVLNIFDYLNAQCGEYANISLGWDTTGVVMKYSSNYVTDTNLWFGRISGYTYINFIGYIITI